MSSDYDATEFVDGDFQAHKSPSSATLAGAGQPQRAPTREEVDSRVAEAQQKLAELKREQEELERQRAALEETRRRQMELQTGRQETVQNLTRGWNGTPRGSNSPSCRIQLRTSAQAARQAPRHRPPCWLRIASASFAALG